MGYNVRQQNVINANDKNILCLAAASSGKTSTIIGRIRRLLDEGADPHSIVCFSFTNQAAQEMKSRIGEEGEFMQISTIHSYANFICALGGVDTAMDIALEEFDKIIEKALEVDWSIYPRVEYLFVDEFQDTDSLQYRFLERIPASHRFYCGDERQCQPAGTMVWLRNNIQKPIEDIKVGDSIVWYDNSISRLSGINVSSRSVEKKVKKISSRDFCNDNLITITTATGETSSYTPNHICFVRLKESEYNHAVYLMCDENNRFRVGKIPITTKNACHKNPWRDKMYKEGCTKIWLLKSFKTDKEARVLEQKISYKYSIPQICWQLDKVQWTKDDIDYIYEGLNTYESAKKCLKDFNRDIEYPLLDKKREESERIHFARNAVAKIFAANLMPNNMEVIVYDKDIKHHKRYEEIKNIKYTYITEPIKVYSLETEGGTYVADGIITHNCIYSFKGTSDRFLRELATDDNFAKYYLIDNYRNPPNILRFANDFLHTLKKVSPSAVPVKKKNGFLDDECTFDDALEEMQWTKEWQKWAVICRTNAEVNEVKRRLNEKYIPNIDIKRGGELDYADLKNLMNRNAIKVATIHSVKGLEFDYVVAIGCKNFNLDERRIAYVAATRARESLYWCPPIKVREDTDDSEDNSTKKKKKKSSSNAFDKVKTIIF